MVVKINELSGTRLKKDLGAVSVNKGYHNHNKSGGNFGIIVRYADHEPMELSGEHDKENIIRLLRWGTIYNPLPSIFVDTSSSKAGLLPTYEDFDYERLIRYLNKNIKEGVDVIAFTHRGM